MNRDQVFISYSHADSDWLKRLQTMLVPLQRQGALDVWEDSRIQVGQDWKEEIEKALERAKVAVLMVSPDFLASDFIAKHELPTLLEAARKEGLTILWVPVRHSLYKETEIARYQAAYNPRTPLSTLTAAEQDAALVQIAEKLRAVKPPAFPSKPPQPPEPLPQPPPERPERPERSVLSTRLLIMLVLVILGGTGLYYLGREWLYQTTNSTQSTADKAAADKAAADKAAADKAAADKAAADKAADKAAAKLPSSLALPNIHGWSAQQVQSLQQQTAQAFKIPVEFQDTLKDGGLGPKMVVIPGGRFQMGSPPDEPQRTGDERPHEVEVAPFAMDKYEVTFEEYDRFATAIQREKPSDSGWGRGRRPVINVTWKDAVAYAEWLSQQTGQTYRLPTEAEWEYAARAGTTTPFYFGTTISTEQANYNGNYTYGGGQKGVYRQKTVEVGQFPANAWGLHDMHGNVWEWNCSEYDENYGGAALRCISDPDSGGPRVLRGGSWFLDPGWLRSAARGGNDPRDRFNIYNWGFRLARTLTL